MRQILSALCVLHANNIMHRDVKPGNVLIRADGSFVLGDFGIARGIQANATVTSAGAKLQRSFLS